jgi:hypothetical protein
VSDNYGCKTVYSNCPLPGLNRFSKEIQFCKLASIKNTEKVRTKQNKKVRRNKEKLTSLSGYLQKLLTNFLRS